MMLSESINYRLGETKKLFPIGCMVRCQAAGRLPVGKVLEVSLRDHLTPLGSITQRVEITIEWEPHWRHVIDRLAGRESETIVNLSPYMLPSELERARDEE